MCVQVRIKGGAAAGDGSEVWEGLGEAGASDPEGESLLRAVDSGVDGLAGVMTPKALSCRIERFIDTQCQEFSGEKDFASLSKEESRRSEQSTLTSGVLMWLVGGEVEAQPVGLYGGVCTRSGVMDWMLGILVMASHKTEYHHLQVWG